MAARRSIKSINWSGIAERLYEEEKGVYLAFKAKSDLYLRNLQQHPEKSPPIDWAFYQKHVSIPGMVETFKKQYESISIPYPTDKYTDIVEAQAKEADKEVKEYIESGNKQIEEYQKKITEIESLMPFSEMTMEDVYDLYPDKCLDPINRPTVWPHHPDDQVDDPPKEH